ncbi:MAG: hypothetical protein QM786_07810 [Breznakibacter sp.]
MENIMQKTQLLNPDSPFRYLVYLVLLFPVFIFRDYTPDNELKYISIAGEALKNHTWFTFYNHGEIYADKPPLFFWLIMASRLLTGSYPMWLIGLFSLLPAIGILAVMDRWFRNSGINHNPAMSNLLLLTTAIFAGSALVVRMDMLMTLFIVLSLYTFFRIYKDEHMQMEKILLPVYIFLAIFSKGPMGFLIPVVSITAFLLVKKEIPSFGRYLGWKQWAVLAGLCTVWFLLVYLEGGSKYLSNILFKQTVGRGVNSFHHKEPLWYYFPRMLWSFAPWILLYIALIWKGIHRKILNTDTQKFFAVIVVANTILLSLVSSKLDIYLLPVYPFVVYLCSSLFPANSNSRGIKAVIGATAAFFTLGLPVFLLAEKHIPYNLSGIIPYFGASLLSIGGAMALAMLLRNRGESAVIYMGSSLLATLFVCAFALPRFNRSIGYREMAETAKEKAEAEQIKRYAYYKFRTAPNMDVFIGRPLEHIESVNQLDSLDKLPQKTILFVRTRDTRREKEFGEWVSARQTEWATDEYRWYILGNRN